MNCPLCGKQEIAFNLNTGKHEPVDHPENVRTIVCSNCMQMILSSNQDKLKSAYRKALQTGELNKAQALRGFIRGDPDEVTRFEKPGGDIAQEQTNSSKENNGETKRPRGRSVRAAPLRMAGHTV
jgi:hypothetical protein